MPLFNILPTHQGIFPKYTETIPISHVLASHYLYILILNTDILYSLKHSAISYKT